MKYLLSALLCLCSFLTSAQDLKYEMSEPIDINTAGWDKVLLMSNGNTVFFHFELRKGIIVKVFDKSRKEIASKKHLCEVLDISVLDRQRAYFKALEEINGEAVLFISQYLDNRETLVRVRIDATTGRMIEEIKLVQSPSYKSKTETFVYNRGEQYDVLCNTIVQGYSETNAVVKTFDSKHNLLHEAPLNIKYNDYQRMALKFAKYIPQRGIVLGFQSFTNDSRDALSPSLLTLAYRMEGQDQFATTKLQLPGYFTFESANISYNSFAQKLNVILTSNASIDIHNQKKFIYPYQSLLIINEDFSDVVFKPLDNQKMNKQIFDQVDTSQMFMGFVDTTYTNSFGQTSVIYSSAYVKKKHLGLITKGLNFKYGITITQLNDKGEETWAGMVPKAVFYFYKEPPLIFDIPGEQNVYGPKIVAKNSDLLILYNDVSKNLERDFAHATDSFYVSEIAQPMLLRLNRKKEMARSHLFGTPVEGVYNLLLSDSGYIDERTKLYATLIRQHKGKEIQTKIAWVQL